MRVLGRLLNRLTKTREFRSLVYGRSFRGVTISSASIPSDSTKMTRSSDKIMDLSQGSWQDIISSCCSILADHGAIAVPTDTIYGLAVHAQSADSVKKLYNIKGRDQNKPISICVADILDVYKWGKVTIPLTLLSKLLPGPVTCVFERTLSLNPDLNPGTTLVGVRIPDHGFMRELCRKFKEPLALTSANRSSEPSALNIDEFECLWPQLDLICDGGSISSPSQSRQGSTVVDLSKTGFFTIIRDGSARTETYELLKSHGLEEEGKLCS